MRKVIFDSSFLMAVAENPTTWSEDIGAGVGKFQPVLPECVSAELRSIASGEGKKSRLARVALEMAQGFSAAPCGRASVDDEIISQALTEGALVATTDSGLLGSLRGAHVGVVTLRRGRVSFG